MVTGGSEGRGIHLVGSIPLSSSEEVFRTVASAIGDQVQRIPDGETGPARSLWVQCQIPFFLGHPQLEMVEPDPDHPGRERCARIRSGGIYSSTTTELFKGRARLRPGVAADEVRFDNLGYADWALESWETFARLQEERIVPLSVRFQVCLPSPRVVPAILALPEVLGVVMRAYGEGLRREVARIVSVVPPDRLAIQWDCTEPVEIDTLSAADRAPLIETLASVGEAIPSGVQLGYHLCYGDFEHRHGVEPKDLADVVAMANDLTDAISRPVDFFHLPVPRNRDDDPYFAPLRRLEIAGESQVILGLIHYSDGVDGARRRMAAATRARPEYAVATECGFGRRDPATILELLRIHAEAARL